MPDIITFDRLAEILGVDLNYFSESVQPAITKELAVEVPVEQPAELPSGKTREKAWLGHVTRQLGGR